MSISGKIKGLLNITGKTSAGLADHLKINRQSLRNKFNRNSFSADDLVRTAEYCDSTLMFVVNEKQAVIFEVKDVRGKPEDE